MQMLRLVEIQMENALIDLVLIVLPLPPQNLLPFLGHTSHGAEKKQTIPTDSHLLQAPRPVVKTLFTSWTVDVTQ